MYAVSCPDPPLAGPGFALRCNWPIYVRTSGQTLLLEHSYGRRNLHAPLEKKKKKTQEREALRRLWRQLGKKRLSPLRVEWSRGVAGGRS